MSCSGRKLFGGAARSVSELQGGGSSWEERRVWMGEDWREILEEEETVAGTTDVCWGTTLI